WFAHAYRWNGGGGGDWRQVSPLSLGPQLSIFGAPTPYQQPSACSQPGCEHAADRDQHSSTGSGFGSRVHMATVVGRRSECRWDRSLTTPRRRRAYAGRTMNLPPDPDHLSHRLTPEPDGPDHPWSLRSRILESIDSGSGRETVAVSPPPERWYRINVILAIGCALLTLMVSVADGGSGLANGFGVLGGLMVSASVAFRMHQPRWSLALAVAGGVALAAFVHHPTAHAVLIPVIVYSMARWADVITRRVTQG